MSYMPIKDYKNILFIMLPYIVRKKEAKNPKIRSFSAFPYGLLSIATFLEMNSQKEINIKIIDCNLDENRDYIQAIKHSLSDFKPDLVGLSMMFDNSYTHLKDISQLIKEHDREIVVVLGGSAASSSYDTIMSEQECLDGICYLEGELPLLRLIDSDNPIEYLENDPSWVTRKSLEEAKRPEKSFIEDLNDVIDIDYKFVDIEKYDMQEAFSPFISNKFERKRQFFLVTSRGCPYKCIFCSNSSIHGNKIRYASVDNIISHVQHLVNEFNMNILTIYDDQLLSKKKRAKELFRRLEPFHLRIECPNGLSVAFIDEEMAYLMKRAGMDTVALAIESGSKYMLEKVIHKPLKLEMVKPVVEILRRHDFFIEGFFVTGIPGETDEYREETLNLIRDVELDWSGFSLATPIRGSKLYELCIENEYIDKNLKIGEIEDKRYILKIPGQNPDGTPLGKRYFMTVFLFTIYDPEFLH